MKRQFIPFLAASLTAVSLLTISPAASAAPSFIFNAKGTNKLNIGNLAAVAAAVNLQVSKFGSATTTQNNTIFSFPIIGGAADAQTIEFESVSVGGIQITNGTDVVVLNSPIVNTTTTQPIMTFLVTINGNLQGRYALFNLKVPDYAKPQDLGPGSAVHAAGIKVTLSPTGANILNQTFGLPLKAGESVGTLTVKSVLGEELPE